MDNKKVILDNSGTEISTLDLGELLDIKLDMEDNNIVEIIELTIEAIKGEMVVIKNENLILYNTLKVMLEKILQNVGGSITDPKFMTSLNNLFITSSNILKGITDMNLTLYDKFNIKQDEDKNKDITENRPATINDINNLLRKQSIEDSKKSNQLEVVK